MHIGCGSVYLADWLNVDVPGPKTFLARQRPDLVEKWKTTEDHYYARHEDKTVDSLRAGPLDQEYVCDVYGDFEHIPLARYECDEILSRHAFEHLSIREARRALQECWRVLRKGGLLRIDVPDHAKTLELLIETRDRFYIRHLLGPRRGDDFGHHVMSYEPHQLRALCESEWFTFVEEEPNIHIFPAFCLKFQKGDHIMSERTPTNPDDPKHPNPPKPTQQPPTNPPQPRPSEEPEPKR